MDELDDWLDEWALTLRGNVSEQTEVVYLRSARQFVAWAREQRPGLDAAGIDRRLCRDWLASLADAGRAESTRRVRGIALRLFLGYVASESDSGLEHNPADGLKLPLPTAPPVQVVSDADLGTLLRVMAGTSFVDRRDTAIVRFLLDTGCRRSEVAGLDLADVDVQHGQAVVHGKGGKIRTVPFSNSTALALRRYLRARRGRGVPPDSGPLFVGTRAEPGRDLRITGDGIWHMFGRRCAAAGLAPIHPHQLRHTWAHDNLANGLGESEVERLAGWTSPTMVRRYGNSVADARARDAARRLGRGDRV